VSDYGPLTVVEPDPYPTPWRLDGVSIVSADGVWLLTVHRKLAERIVKAVNEASQ
jgi:hypothetical protein